MNLHNAFPRVLLVLIGKVKVDDPGNLLIRTEFGDWPKDCLGQIHAMGLTKGKGELCGHNYQLQAGDRAWGSLFLRIRRSVFKMVGPDEILDVMGHTLLAPMRKQWKVAKKQIGDWLIETGIWEVIFRVRLSRSIENFVEKFEPEIIYCQGYSLGFVALPLLISKRFNIPICIQITDDWPSYTYRKSPVGYLLRWKTKKLIGKASLRMAFGEKMKSAYEKRYQRPFLVTYHADALDRFPLRRNRINLDRRSILFVGNLGLRRYEPILDLLQVVRSLDSDAQRPEIHVFCPSLPKDVPAALRTAPEIVYRPLPMHDELPSVLVQADVLFLPESFTIDPRMITLSISTKCHLYMMSGVPIMVYGPAYSGTVDYAVREGWAAVVNERDLEILRSKLRELLTNNEYGEEICKRARIVAGKNHNVSDCRRRFLDILRGAMGPP